MGSNGRPRQERVIAYVGRWPRRRVPQQLAPACPGHPRKQMSGACFRRWGSGRGCNPAGEHVPYRNGDLDLPVPVDVQPGTFGGPLLATVSTVQPMSAICKHRPLASARSRVSAEGRRRPLLSSKDHSAGSNVTQTTLERGGRPVRGTYRQSAERVGADNSDCHTSPASWVVWEERSADRVREPGGCSQADGKRAQRNRCQAKRSGLPGSLPHSC
jgi:hypothetical protein